MYIPTVVVFSFCSRIQEWSTRLCTSLAPTKHQTHKGQKNTSVDLQLLVHHEFGGQDRLLLLVLDPGPQMHIFGRCTKILLYYMCFGT